MKTIFLSFLLLAFPLLAQHPARLQPPNLSLNSGIDMRGGPLLRASEVQTDTLKLGSSLVNLSTYATWSALYATNAALRTTINADYTFHTNAQKLASDLIATNDLRDAVTTGRLAAVELSLSDLHLFREGNVLYFVTAENVTNTVTITPVGP